MSGEEGRDPQVKATQDSLNLMARVLGQIGVLTLVLILVAVFGGLWLDRQLGTRPLFTILLIVGSFPISLYIIYRVAINAVARIKPAQTANAPRAKEDVNDNGNS
jgi:F0F1-type ATP synthase assembly protein I